MDLHDELRGFDMWVLGQATSEFGIGFDDVGNALGRVESGDLDNIFLCKHVLGKGNILRLG